MATRYFELPFFKSIKRINRFYTIKAKEAISTFIGITHKRISMGNSEPYIRAKGLRIADSEQPKPQHQRSSCKQALYVYSKNITEYKPKK